MKNSICFLLILALISCDKLDELTKFSMDFNQTVTIPSSTGINLPFTIFTPDIETNSESEFEGNDTRKDLIEKITLTKLNLALNTPEDGDFGFLKSIEVYISADEQEEIKIAYNDAIDENIGATLDLTTVDVDLKEYVTQDNFKLRLNTVTREVITQDHEIDVNSTFFVDAQILGL